jgi:hypothetical protein
MKEMFHHIAPREMQDVKQLQDCVVMLMNLCEQQSSLVQELRIEIRSLKDEINILKGEDANPKFPKSGKSKQPSKETGEPKKKTGKGKNHKQGSSKKGKVKIDQTKVIKPDFSILPSDAVLKEYKQYIQQDLKLKRCNTLYRVAIYHSASEGKTYRGDMPADYQGHFGLGIVGLTQLLHHYGDMTQGRLEAFFKSFDIHISSGTISHIITQKADWAIAEQSDILRSGIEHSPFTQMDGTKSVQRGESMSTQILCGDKFSVFYTMPSKSRLDILSAIQGKPSNGLLVALNSKSEDLFTLLKVSQRDELLVRSLLTHNQPILLTDLEHLLDQSRLKQHPGICLKIKHALALSHYHDQQECPVIKYLLTDDAPEYSKVSAVAQALCWIHDVRYYRKLIPRLDIHKRAHQEVLTQYWSFYEELKQYRQLSPHKQRDKKKQLSEEFDEIFQQQTDYFQLNACLERTFKNKEKLLAVLDNPAVPLHNNAAERGARRVVRKRDISLHTWSEQGTRVRDAYMTIVESAAKLGVNAWSYIKDRISGEFKMNSLAQSIQIAYA